MEDDRQFSVNLASTLARARINLDIASTFFMMPFIGKPIIH